MKSALVAACAALVVGLSGCGDINGGDQEIADFEAWLADNPAEGVSVETSRAENVLPWVGDGFVTLLIADPEVVVEAADHVCDYNRSNPPDIIDFIAHAGVVFAPFVCSEDSLTQLDEDVHVLNSQPGLTRATIRDNRSLDASFGSRQQLLTTFPVLAGRFDSVNARTEGLEVSDDAGADPSVREAFAVHLTDLDPRVSRISLYPGIRSERSSIRVEVTSRPGFVRRQMQARSPGMPITVHLQG